MSTSESSIHGLSAKTPSGSRVCGKQAELCRIYLGIYLPKLSPHKTITMEGKNLLAHGDDY